MIVTLDFETYYDSAYSLRKLSEVEYILSPRFEVIMCAIKLDNGPTNVYVGDAAVSAALSRIDWDNAAVLAHNTRFDGAILAWHYGIIPKLYLDTMSMGRAMIYVPAGGASLAKLAHYLHLAPKGDEVVRAMGITLAAFTHEQLQDYAAYCAHDTDLCRQMFDRMIAKFPTSELMVIDLLLRMFIDPQVQLNGDKLAAHLAHVQVEKAQIMARVSHIDPAVFSSNVKFAQLLEGLGVEVPVKISPATGDEIPAIAKNDWEFKELCSDPEQPPEVQAVLAARIGAKSTLDETRTATLLRLSQQDWPMPRPPGVDPQLYAAAKFHHLVPMSRGKGWATVPYRYFGAHTGRPSGDGGVNFTNFKRGSPIRDAIEAPDGFRVVHRDSSQIECRINAWLAKCHQLLQAFRDGRDVYSEFASMFYGVKVTKADVPRRFAGKTAILSLGYGAGPPRFRRALFIGNGGVSLKISLDEADALVKFYRYRRYPEIPQLWTVGDLALHSMVGFKLPRGIYHGELPAPLRLGTDCIWLPNNTCIQYTNLRRDFVFESFIYDGPNNQTKKIYGCKVIENVCQALARIIITDVMLRVFHQSGYRPFMSTYDSHDFLVPLSEVEAFDRLLEVEFGRAPTWAPDLPLASEGGWGRTLLEAEKGLNI